MGEAAYIGRRNQYLVNKPFIFGIDSVHLFMKVSDGYQFKIFFEIKSLKTIYFGL